MHSIVQDVRYGFRVLRLNRGFALAAILTIALGVGINASVFSIADGMLFRPLPYHDSDRLVELFEYDVGGGQTYGTFSRTAFEALQSGSTSLEGLAFRQPEFGDTLIGADQPIRVSAYGVSRSLFGVLKIQPVLGRLFVAEDFQTRSERPALLSHRFWQRLGGNPDIVDTTLRFEERLTRVIGVLPAGLIFPTDQGNPQPDLVTPVAAQSDADRERSRVPPPIGRLKAGVTRAEAQSEAEAIVRAVEKQGGGTGTITVRVLSLRDGLFFGAQPILLVLLGASGFVMLIVCVNISSLLLARGGARERELAVRTALGASRGRLVRQLAVESLILAAIGGPVGLLLAFTTFDVIYAQVPGRLYRMFPAAIDDRVVIFSGVVSLLAALLFAAAPAMRFSKPDVNRSLRNAPGRRAAGSTHWRAGSMLIAAEIAVVVVLLTGDGLMVNSFARLRAVDLGVTPENIHVLTAAPPMSRYSTPSSVYEFYADLLNRIRSQSGIDAAAGSAGLPVGSLGWSPFTPPGTTVAGSVWIVTDGYFRTWGIPVVAGRTFTERETLSNAPVAVVSAFAARLSWPNGDAVGKTVQNPGDVPRQIVGIVGEVRQSVRQDAVPTMYRPFGPAAGPSSMVIAVRSRQDARTIAALWRTEVRRRDPNVIPNASPITDALDAQMAVARFQTILFSVFGGLGLILAAVGVFGVIAYATSRRTHEIGVRMALGAEAADVKAMVWRNGLMPVFVGLALGLVGAFWLTRLLAGWLFEVTPHDPATFASVALILLATGLVAMYLPARRASRVDPIEALRAE